MLFFVDFSMATNSVQHLCSDKLKSTLHFFLTEQERCETFEKVKLW